MTLPHMATEAIALTLLVGTLALPGHAPAAEPADPPIVAADPAAQDDNQPSDPPAAATKRPEAGNSGEVFVPTEEISEDYAVSFPVDI